jgi:hypothetical protein
LRCGLENRAVDDDVAAVAHDRHAGGRSAQHVVIEIVGDRYDAANSPRCSRGIASPTLDVTP